MGDLTRAQALEPGNSQVCSEGDLDIEGGLRVSAYTLPGGIVQALPSHSVCAWLGWGGWQGGRGAPLRMLVLAASVTAHPRKAGVALRATPGGARVRLDV